MTPAVSVILPTHDREELVARTLSALALQTVPRGAFEVVVVADGCSDGTASRVRSMESPFPVRVIEQPASGAAAARNRGAEAAAAPLLLFLDDDMEASPRLVEAHLDSHRRDPGIVAQGYFRLPRDGNDDIVASLVDVWWGRRFSSMCEAGYRFSFTDLFTGNVSLSRELFLRAGRFDERFRGRAGEDYELAARLLKAGAAFRFVPEAACVHHYHPTWRRMAARAYAEGRGHVRIASLHPEAFPALPVRAAADGGPWVRIAPGLSLRPWTLARLSGCLGPVIESARRLKVRRALHPALGFVRHCNYWRGVIDELGSEEELYRFTQDMPLAPSFERMAEIDLGKDMGRIREILEACRADAAALWYGGRMVGDIPPAPLAETLREEHVLHAVRKRFPSEYLEARLAAGEWR